MTEPTLSLARLDELQVLLRENNGIPWAVQHALPDLLYFARKGVEAAMVGTATVRNATTSVFLHDLEELDKKATPGPWETCWMGIGGNITGFHVASYDYGSSRPIVAAQDPQYAPEMVSNGELIALMRNHLSELIRLARLGEEVERAGRRLTGQTHTD